MSTIRRTLLVLIATITAALCFQSPAQAVQHYGATGWYGGVTPYKITNTDVWTLGPGSVVLPGLLVGGPVVTRSNGSAGVQKVEISYVLTRYHANGFTSAEQFTYWYSIGSGVSQVKLPDLRRSVGAAGGTINVRFSVAWYDYADRWLGQRGVNYNGTTNDYYCSYSHYVSCQVNTGSIWVG